MMVCSSIPLPLFKKLAWWNRRAEGATKWMRKTPLEMEACKEWLRALFNHNHYYISKKPIISISPALFPNQLRFACSLQSGTRRKSKGSAFSYWYLIFKQSEWALPPKGLPLGQKDGLGDEITLDRGQGSRTDAPKTVFLKLAPDTLGSHEIN